MRTFPKVPRIMTSWFPRREPKVLKSSTFTPLSCRYRLAGSRFGMAPAGEMWSVVTDCPRRARTRAPSMSSTGGSSVVMPSKKGGCCT